MDKDMARMHEQLLEDALQRLSANREEVVMQAWEQTWPNTSCGFGGIAGQAFTTAPTVVVQHKDTEATVVYHANRFAYRVLSPSASFQTALQQKRLPGKSEVSADLGDMVVHE